MRPLMVQVTAQALCLEEMLGANVPEVAIYLVSERRREVLPTDDWRLSTEACIAEARQSIWRLDLGAPRYQGRRCRRCSLLEACQPHQAES